MPAREILQTSWLAGCYAELVKEGRVMPGKAVKTIFVEDIFVNEDLSANEG